MKITKTGIVSERVENYLWVLEMFLAHINIFSSIRRWKMSSGIVKISFMVTLWKATFWGFAPKDLGGQAWSSWGPPGGLASHMCGAPWSSTSLPIMPFMCDICMGILGFCGPSLPLGFPINRGGGAALHTHSFSHTSSMQWSGFFSPSHEKSFVEP